MKATETAREFLKITVNRQAFNHMNRMASLITAGRDLLSRAKTEGALPLELRLEIESWIKTVSTSPSN
jgi:hypothetical protein